MSRMDRPDTAPVSAHPIDTAARPIEPGLVAPEVSAAAPAGGPDRFAEPGAPGISRRAFLAGTAAVAGAASLSALTTAGCGTPYGPYPSPSRFITVSTAGLEVGVPSFVEFELTPAAPSVPEASPPLGSMPPGRGGAWLVKQEDGTVVAYVPFCTHMACVYDWKPDQSHFVCPCHPGIFSIDGAVVSGPPPGPLWRFETRQSGADTIEIGWADAKA